MDASDIFRKLSSGASFKSKKQGFPCKYPLEVKTEPEPTEVESKPPRKRKKVNGENNDAQRNPIKLLDDLISNSYDSEPSKKSKKQKVEKSDKVLEKEKLAELRNRHSISAIGSNVPPPVETFEDFKEKLKLSSIITRNLKKSGYEGPTPVQMQAVPLLMEGRELLACAPTGSGKTAAFLVPVLHQLRAPQKGGFRALVVSPTRELATQSFRECQRLSEGTGLRAIIISKIGHSADEKFNQKANTTYDILFTTPNRLVYLLQQEPPVISLKKVEWLIVDECDKLFEAGVRGFRDQLAVIYTACDSVNTKRAMFSATQAPPLTKWCRKNLRRLVTINIGIRNSSCEDVEQELLFVGNESGKLIAIRNLIQQGLTPPVLVFVQSKERAKELFNELIYDGINVDVIHSDRTQTQRDNVIRSFREGKIWVLICTELMGRGIDFKGVNLVVNYDFPPSTVSYIHRVGRTGRAGRKGRAITYVTLDDTTNLRSIARIVKEAGGAVPDYMLALKKAGKREKKEFERRAPRREAITTTPVYQEILEKKKENAIKRSKRKVKKATEKLK